MMKVKKVFWQVSLLIFIIIVTYSSSSFACSAFVSTRGNQILIGNNEDYYTKFSDIVVRIRPSDNKNYGRLMIGYNQMAVSMGGINDQGLFYDSFIVPAGDWRRDPEKEAYNNFMLDDILGSCATVEEVIAFCRRYNLPYFKNNQLFVVDKSGKAAVISWGETDVEVTRMKKDYQAVTNFLLQHPERGNTPCRRYASINKTLSNNKKHTFELACKIMDSVHAEASWGKTQYTNIVNLLNGDFRVFYGSNFEEYIIFNISEELKNSYKNYQIPDYVSDIRSLETTRPGLQDPKRVSIKWTGKPDSKYTVYCSTDPEFKDCQPMPVPDKSRVMACFTFALENIEPNTTYYYKINGKRHGAKSSVSITKSFKTSGTD